MLEQILLNLAVNSRDAMPRGGRLAIRISPCEIGTAHIRTNPSNDAGPLYLPEPHGHGRGDPAGESGAYFRDRFFTTKEELGKGTGLGLATVYGIVKQHKGWIEVDSELNKGTTFKIYFPATTLEVPTPETTETQMRALGGTETVLVVEDGRRTCGRSITRTLNRHGFTGFSGGGPGHSALLQMRSSTKNRPFGLHRCDHAGWG